MRKAWRTWVLFLTLLCVTFVFWRFQGGFVSGFLFYSSVSLAAYLAVLQLLAIRGMSAKRVFSKTRLTAGERLRVEIVVTRLLPIPLCWYVVKDVLPDLADAKRSYSNVFSPGFRRQLRFSYEAPKLQRGVYSFSQVSVSCGDLFGFWRWESRLTSLDQIVVYPAFKRLTNWQGQELPSHGRRLSQARREEDVSTLVGVRDYVQGDRLNRIHWKSSARSQKWKSKEFEQRLSKEYILFLDASDQSYPLLKGRSPLFERGIEWSAALADYALRHRFAVGFVAQSRREVNLPASQKGEQFKRLMDELVLLHPGGQFPFADVLDRRIGLLTRETIAVLITPSLSDALVARLRKYRARQHLLEVVYLTLDEKGEGRAVAALRKAGIPVKVVASQ